jgi:RNA polymerase sigma-70 factor (ECF subfamily)
MEISDEELVARAVAANDQEAFGELVRRHQSRVRGWLRQLTGDESQADELAQQSFIRAWEKLHTFSGRGKFPAWIMKLAYNVFRQSYRDAQRDQRLGDALGAVQALIDPVQGELHDQEYPDLSKMLAVLSDDERHAMVLCYAYGLSHGDASEVTGLPLGTLKSHIKRGKEKIRSRFDITENDHD